MFSWEDLQDSCLNCRKCGLATLRKNVVIGRGNPNASMLFVGEGPGEQEDIQGLPFVGPAGKLLDLLLTALMVKEDSYYITNIVKCRPPGNRIPFDEEAFQCLPYLRTQLQMIKPKIIICLGSTATKYIVDKEAKITQVRGRIIEKKGYLIMPTFHPAALLRDSSKKRLMWDDLKSVLSGMPQKK